MLVLGIETSTPCGGVALFDEQHLLGSVTMDSARGHSRHALPWILTMLREARATVDDLDVVAVGRGPGSFTGVRVGMALAKGLCETGSPRLVTVSSLMALAVRAYGGEAVDTVVPLMNARQGEVYGGFYPVREGAVLLDTVEEFALAPEEVAERMPGRCLLAGAGALAFRPLFEQTGGANAVFARLDRLHPSAEQIAWLGLGKAKAGRFVAAEDARPVYLRDAVAVRAQERAATHTDSME